MSAQFIQQFQYHFYKGNYQMAVQSLQDAIQNGNRTGEVYFNLGRSYDSSGDLKSAIKSYGIAVGYSPNEPIYWLHYGYALEKSGQQDEAAAILAQASCLTDDLDYLVDAYERLQKFRTKYSLKS